MSVKFLFFGLMILGFTHCAGTSHHEEEGFVSETREGLHDGVYQIDARKYQLKNGMTVILSRNPKLPVFSIYTFYKVGSKNENEGMTGATHFLEHMMFKGAKKYGKGQFDKVIEKNGGYSNAYTNYDNTVYYEKMPISALENILDLEADRMQNLLLEPIDFVNEKDVVLEERKMRYENSPRGQIYIGVMNKVFGGTPYETPVIGKIKDIKTVSRNQVYQYFKDFYAPNNATVVIVGDIDYDDTLSLVREEFEGIPPSKNLTKNQKNLHEEFKKSNFKKNATDHFFGKSENPLFVLAFPGVRYGTEEGYVGDVLAGIVAGNRSSFLDQKYVHSAKPILSSISASNYTLQYDGTFFITGEMIHNIGLNTMRDKMINDFKSFCKNGIDERSVQKVKNQYLIQFYNELQTNGGIANYLGTIENYLGDFTKYVDEIKKYQAVKVNQVKDFCEEYLVKNNHYFMSVWNKNKKALKI
ncbi:MAG: insulinase family protein [Halobacteriovoraceae bacterium]|nr:insulinase family protein [Halobacteriovoraceae bacterium]MCB9095584.1 insulinase family protein [Halobacteriovoraceae bacterium]